MTRDEAQEYGRMVKALDVVVRVLRPVLWPLCLPALTLLREVEATRYVCSMCRNVGGHTCSCPVTSTKRGLRARERGLCA